VTSLKDPASTGGHEGTGALEKGVHRGTILDASESGFDAGGAAFACLFRDQENPETIYLFYTGCADIALSRASIGLAVSSDGLEFRKTADLNPLLECDNRNGKAMTPAVFRVGGHFYMVYARNLPRGGTIFMAYASDPKGPWHNIREVAKPEHSWEGKHIDLGPSVVKLTGDEVLVYYSNVPPTLRPNFLQRHLLGSKYPKRQIGILRIKIRSPSNFETYKFEGNPLRHLNGSKGGWNESLFCPGYFRLGDVHCLLPAASTYSAGFPFRQYIGLAADSTPYLQRPMSMRILIDGPGEKKQILRGIRGEIALDTPCPLLKGDELYLSYAAMDRDNGVWRTVLTVFPLLSEQMSTDARRASLPARQP